MRAVRSSRDSGQAAVETAITMPLALFLVLGITQLFMLLQGRLFAEHAAYMAARVGSVQRGNCEAMRHAAVMALLPSFTTFLGKGTSGSSNGEKLANAFRTHADGLYHGDSPSDLDYPHTRAIVWLYRLSPRYADINNPSADVESDFDSPDTNAGQRDRYYTLRVRAVYWYPLRIPFANWVMAAMFRAYFAIQPRDGVNPLMPAQRSNWANGPASLGVLASEFDARYQAGQYEFPVVGTATMRMMTPPWPDNFTPQHCIP